MVKTNESTIYQDIVLASSSSTRIEYIRKFIPSCKVCHHKVNEEEKKTRSAHVSVHHF